MLLFTLAKTHDHKAFLHQENNISFNANIIARPQSSVTTKGYLKLLKYYVSVK